MKKELKIIIKTSLGSVIGLIMLATVSSQADAASSCYHHYNDNAWHGTGTAIVFCLNSGGGRLMAACNVVDHKTGKKLFNYHEHGGRDHGRQVFTLDGLSGGEIARKYNAGRRPFPVDIVCTGVNGKKYTYELKDSGTYSDPGVCGVEVGYIGGPQCRNDFDTVTAQPTRTAPRKRAVAPANSLLLK